MIIDMMKKISMIMNKMKRNKNKTSQIVLQEETVDFSSSKKKGYYMSNMTNIIKRVVNSKRHTVGFVLSGNRRVTRSEAVRMAKASRIRGVRVVSGSQGSYLQSTTSRNLYDLPTVNA